MSVYITDEHRRILRGLLHYPLTARAFRNMGYRWNDEFRASVRPQIVTDLFNDGYVVFEDDHEHEVRVVVITMLGRSAALTNEA